MSGRKQCEVQDVLAQGARARKATADNLECSINSNSRKIEAADRELENQKISAPTERLNEEAIKMFGNEAEKQVKACEELARKLANLKGHDAEKMQLQGDLGRLKQELGACDQEANAILWAISDKYAGYCDAEYNRAQRLKRRYQDLGLKFKALDREMNHLASKAQSDVNNAKAMKQQLKAYQEAIAQMNVMAKNKAAADALKSQLEDSVNSISAKWARKFLQSRYEALNNKIDIIMTKSDTQIIKEAPAVQNELNQFIAELNEKIAVYETQKADAESLKKQALEITDNAFMDPMDYFKNGEKAKGIALFNYLERYEKVSFASDYEEIMAKAKIAMDEEHFLEAQKLYKMAYNKAAEARDHALDIQENMIKCMQLAKGIQDVMHGEMKYDVKTIINNGNPLDGFNIACSIGDEKIDFNIVYDKDGKPVIDVDHQESKSGSCGASWQGIAQAMHKKGVPVTDVKKNGQSILKGSTLPVGGGGNVPGVQKLKQ